MHLEIFFLSFLWIFGIAAIALFIPKHQLRKSLFALLVFKSLIWVSMLFHVKFGLLSFPIREFPKAIDVSFTTAYFFYPFMYGLYIVLEPKESFWARLGYMSIWISGLTAIDYLLEKFSDLIVYENYSWHWSWLNFLILFALSNLIYKWFFKDNSLFQADRSAVK